MSTASHDRFEIEDADVNDLERLAEIENAAHQYPWSTSMLEESLCCKHIFKKLTYNSEVAGFFVLMDSGDFWEILDIVIAPEFQSKGLGAFLLGEIIGSGGKAKVEKIFLEVRESNLVAQSLYRKCGFQVISTRKKYYHAQEGREDGLVMMLKIDEQ